MNGWTNIYSRIRRDRTALSVSVTPDGARVVIRSGEKLITILVDEIWRLRQALDAAEEKAGRS